MPASVRPQWIRCMVSLRLRRPGSRPAYRPNCRSFRHEHGGVSAGDARAGPGYVPARRALFSGGDVAGRGDGLRQTSTGPPIRPAGARVSRGEIVAAEHGGGWLPVERPITGSVDDTIELLLVEDDDGDAALVGELLSDPSAYVA